MQHFNYQKETTQMVIYACNSLNVYIQTDRQTDKPMQVWRQRHYPLSGYFKTTNTSNAA